MRAKNHIIVPALIMLLVGLAACSNTQDPASPLPRADKDLLPSGGDPVDVDNFVITYDGRTFDGQQTTFQWTVAGTGEGPALRYFFVELPACAPAPDSFMPAEGAVFHSFTDPDVTGLKWLLSLDAADTQGRQHAITFPGDVPEGTVRGIYHNGLKQVRDIPGPCAGAGAFEISGTVFIDADADGIQDAAEGGLGDVVVEVSLAGGAAATVVTDSDGRYSIARGAGTWTVTVDTAAYPEAFNPTLAASFDATTVLSREVTVGPDAADVDFGFNASIDDIISDLENGVILPSGESALWWKVQFREAIRQSHLYVLHNGEEAVHRTNELTGANNPPRSSYYDPQVLLGFLSAIEGLYLPLPYVFTPGQELESAYQALRHTPVNDYEDLYRELLTTELNFVSGRGLDGVDPALLDALVSWGESLLVMSLEDAGKADLNLPGATRIFRTINTGGGGGIDD